LCCWGFNSFLLSFFLLSFSLLRLGITIDTFVSLRKKLEARIDDTEQKCFICGIEKNTFNRTLDRNAFRQHIKIDQNLWNYIFFIIFVWEQDKDDDDGLESFIRKCVANDDLSWFPMNKAVRLAQHQEKGDITSLKYRFRQEMEKTEASLNIRMNDVKEQLSRTIARVEKALEYDENEGKRGKTARTVSTAGSNPKTAGSVGFGPLGEVTPVSTAAEGETREGRDGENITSTGPKRRRSLNKVPIPATTSKTPITIIKQATVLDADKLGQMHVRMVSITGFKIPPSFIKYIVVRIVTKYDTSHVIPLPTVQSVDSFSQPGSPEHGFREKTGGAGGGEREQSQPDPSDNMSSRQVNYRSKSVERVVSTSLRHSRSSFIKAASTITSAISLSSRAKAGGTTRSISDMFSSTAASSYDEADIDGSSSSVNHPASSHRLQLRFDLLGNSPTLVHQGMLPSFDLSKIKIKVQILFNLKLFYLDNFHVDLLERIPSYGITAATGGAGSSSLFGEGRKGSGVFKSVGGGGGSNVSSFDERDSDAGGGLSVASGGSGKKRVSTSAVSVKGALTKRNSKNVGHFELSPSDVIFMGGATIPMTTLLTKANEGKLIEISFIQQNIEIPFPSHYGHSEEEKKAFTEKHGILFDSIVTTTTTTEETPRISSARSNNSDSNLPRPTSAPSSSLLTSAQQVAVEKSKKLHRKGSATFVDKDHHLHHVHIYKKKSQKDDHQGEHYVVMIPSSDTCNMTLSSVASPKLLQDWAFVSSKR
jgi:hypothetical protein